MGRGTDNKVLVVNDIPDQLERMDFLLRQSGFRVLTACDGREGFNLAVQEQPDLIICNVSMPRLDGIEMCRLLREHPGLHKTLVLLVSDIRRDSESVVEGLKVGAEDFLEAPYDPMLLIAKVERLLERRSAEVALKQSAERFRALIENSTDIIAIWRVDGTIKYESPSIIRVLGYQPEELVGKSAFDFIHPDDVPQVLESIHHTFEQGEISQNLEYRFRHKDGSWCFFESTSKTFVDESGELVGAVISRDVSERKQAEEKLRQSESQLAEAQHIAHVGSWNRNLPGDLLNWSDEHFRIFGLEPQAFELTLETVVREYIHPEDRDLLRDIVESSLKTLEPFSLYYRVIHPDGAVRTIHSRGNIVSDGQGNPIRMFGTAQDVTERRSDEEHLKISNEKLRALSARLQTAREEEGTRIAREIHDELGSALTGLKMDISWLSKRLSESGNVGAPEKLTSMAELIDETIQKVRNIATELRPSVLDHLGLAAAIEWQAREFQNRTEIACRLISLQEEVTLSSEQATAVFRIFQEILTNIARHAQATLVEVFMEESAGYLILKVADNGRGIKEKDISDTKSLGILGMRERAVAFGGRVEIIGVESKGTTVTVRLPRP